MQVAARGRVTQPDHLTLIVRIEPRLTVGSERRAAIRRTVGHGPDPSIGLVSNDDELSFLLPGHDEDRPRRRARGGIALAVSRDLPAAEVILIERPDVARFLACDQ